MDGWLDTTWSSSSGQVLKLRFGATEWGYSCKTRVSSEAFTY